MAFFELDTSFGGYNANKTNESHIYNTNYINGKKKRKNRTLRGNS